MSWKTWLASLGGVVIAAGAAWGQQPFVEIVMPEDGTEFQTHDFTIVYRVVNPPAAGFDASIYVQYPDLTRAVAYCIVGFAPIAGDPMCSHEVVSASCWCSQPGMCYSKLEVKAPHLGNRLRAGRAHLKVRYTEIEQPKNAAPWPSGEWHVRVLVGGELVGADDLWFTVAK